MHDNYLLISITVMILVSWLPRVLPLLLIRQKIKQPFIRSLLFYVPYAVLAAMTIPAIFFSTSSIWSALAGLLTALILGWLRKSLLTVAIGASFIVFIIEKFLHL